MIPLNEEISISENTDENFILGKSLQTLIRENSRVHWDICDFEAKSKKGLKVHMTKTHAKTIEAQTLIHNFIASLRFSGSNVGDCNEYYMKNLYLNSEYNDYK